MSIVQQWNKSDRKRIVILRALPLGDLLCAVPAFRALRAAFPNAHITLAGLPRSADFVERFSTYLDDFIAFPGFPGFPEQTPNIAEFPFFLVEMQNLNFDLAVQMQGPGGCANSLISLWGAERYAGFYVKGEYCPDQTQFLEYPAYEPEVYRHLRLMEFLGVPSQGDDLEFPLFDEDWQSFSQLQQTYDLQKNYVCIHPSANGMSQDLPARHFADIANGLAAHGFQVILTGTHAEVGFTTEVAGYMQAQAINLAGKTDLGGFGALISQAALLVSNDAGISQLATALKIPSMILFSESDSSLPEPKNKQLHKFIKQTTEVSPLEILTQAESHLKELGTYAY